MMDFLGFSFCDLKRVLLEVLMLKVTDREHFKDCGMEI